MEVLAEDGNGLKSRAERLISLTGNTDPEVSLTAPVAGSVLQKGEIVEFTYTANEDVNAYLEIDGMIHWQGRVAFDGTVLPTDGATMVLNDGTGRGDITFEFDDDGVSSDTEIDASEVMQVEGRATLTSGGTYLGTEAREYLVEIDSDDTTPSFRWSIDGGVSFNNIRVPVNVANTAIELSAGVTVSFDSVSAGDYQVGDRWRIRAYPVNEMVEVSNQGTFAQMLTRKNLIRTINRVRNEGKRPCGRMIRWREDYMIIAPGK